MKTLTIITQTVLLLTLSNFTKAQSVGGGPLPIRNSRPYNLLFLQFRPESPDVLTSGRSQINLQLDLINNMLTPNPVGNIRVVEDNEYDRLSLSYSRGLGHNREVFGSTSLTFRNGGILDKLMNTTIVTRFC